MDSLTPAIELGLAYELERVAGADRLLVASDFDGTLAPLVDDPARARALPAAEAALISLAAMAAHRGGARVGTEHGQPPSRRRSPQRPRHPGGGHGIEWEDAAPLPEETAQLDALVRSLDDVTEDFLGAWVERKPFSAVVHLRCVPPESLSEAHDAALAVVRSGDHHVLQGHGVVEVLVRAPAKGVAIQALRSSLEADTVVYLGDDVTDDTAFAVLSDTDLGISIGPTPTQAEFQVASPRAAADVLAQLAEARARWLTG